MKAEERQIKAMFLTGCLEWVFKLFFQYVIHYNPLWIQVMGALGTGMIIYSMALSHFVFKGKKIWRNKTWSTPN